MRTELLGAMAAALDETFDVGPIIAGQTTAGGNSASLAHLPARPARAHRHRAHHHAARRSTPPSTAPPRRSTPGTARRGLARAQILEAAADLFERDRAKLMAVIVREAGKTLEGALGDVREAVDYLRYYASEARRLFGAPVQLPGPTGERNTLTLNGRGVFACISPWNFPLAIFTGQVAAALAAGNAVLAKPAEQTPITAFLATQPPARGRRAARRPAPPARAAAGSARP